MLVYIPFIRGPKKRVNKVERLASVARWAVCIALLPYSQVKRLVWLNGAAMRGRR